MGEKTVWDDANVKHFIDICKEEVQAGNKPVSYLYRTGWKNLEEKFEARTGKKLTKTQLKNNWDNFKKYYTFFMELKNTATWLGWNDVKQTVDCASTWWDERSRGENEDTMNTIRSRKADAVVSARGR